MFAGIPTRDFTPALAWYERFLGRAPDRFPHSREAVWQLGERALVYLVEDADRAGSTVITLIVDDLDAWLGAAASRGIRREEMEHMSGGQRRVTVVDLDGNSIGVAQVP